MTLVEKINYLIAQINNANSDQVAIKTTADNALAEVAEATDEDKVTSPVEKPKDETKPSNPGGVQDTNKSAKEQAWEAFANSVDKSAETLQGIKNGTIPVNRSNGNIGTLNTGYGTLTNEQLRLYNAWYNMAE